MHHIHYQPIRITRTAAAIALAITALVVIDALSTVKLPIKKNILVTTQHGSWNKNNYAKTSPAFFLPQPPCSYRVTRKETRLSLLGMYFSVEKVESEIKGFTENHEKIKQDERKATTPYFATMAKNAPPKEETVVMEEAILENIKKLNEMIKEETRPSGSVFDTMVKKVPPKKEKNTAQVANLEENEGDEKIFEQETKPAETQTAAAEEQIERPVKPSESHLKEEEEVKHAQSEHVVVEVKTEHASKFVELDAKEDEELKSSESEVKVEEVFKSSEAESHPKSTRPPNYSSFTSQTSTMRESAVVVDWDHVPEIERRIEHGLFYEPVPEYMKDVNKYYHGPQYVGNSEKDDSQHDERGRMDEDASHVVDKETPVKRGVFCGIVSTPEERERLRSANCDLEDDVAP